MTQHDPLLDTLLPGPPGWRLDWPAIDQAMAEVRDLKGCPQEPVYHGEGDVWFHTRMVCEALIADPAWQALPANERRAVFWAAVLHDIGKPATTRHEDGRITSRGHSKRGEIMARIRLWHLGADLHERERIASLVHHHLIPFHLLERDDPLRLVARISLTTRCDWLSLLARADANGRIAADVQRLRDDVELFDAYAQDAGCHGQPLRFASDHSRFVYFRKPGRDQAYEAYDDTRLSVTLMAGLPAAGKDTWVAQHGAGRPVVSLDGIRQELGVRHVDNQGAVIQEARERARVHLRAARDFIWNATNLSRQMRGNCLDLFADYNARVEIIHRESAPHVIETRNRERDDSVPAKAFARMLERWEAPDLTEAHAVKMISSS